LIGIAFSVKDPAGKGIADFIKNYYSLEKSDECKNAVECYVGKNFYLVGFREDVIYFEFLDERIPENTKEYIILSRHSSTKGIKSYTVHHTGNFGEALYGGRKRALAVANPITAHKLLKLLRNNCIDAGKDAEYEVSYEATHHGPTENDKPLCFIEIGSTLSEWKDPVNHKIVGQAVIELLEDPKHVCREIAIGIGGGHYPRKHTALAIQENICYGHIMAKYALSYLNDEMLSLMTERCMPKPRTIIVEKKGTRREHRETIEKYVEVENMIVRYI